MKVLEYTLIWGCSNCSPYALVILQPVLHCSRPLSVSGALGSETGLVKVLSMQVAGTGLIAAVAARQLCLAIMLHAPPLPQLCSAVLWSL